MGEMCIRDRLNTPATDLMMPRLLIRVSTESDMILPVTGRKDPTAIFNARLESESPAPVMAVCSESRPVKATVRIMIQRLTCLLYTSERLFLKSAHTAPYVLGSVDVGADTERQLHQLDYLKSAGFNMVRFISGPALPEMLDYCDRIGLMVYEETAMAWFPTDCSITGELVTSEISQLLYRDRNHVSFSILGLLNDCLLYTSVPARLPRERASRARR